MKASKKGLSFHFLCRIAPQDCFWGHEYEAEEPFEQSESDAATAQLLAAPQPPASSYDDWDDLVRIHGRSRALSIQMEREAMQVLHAPKPRPGMEVQSSPSQPEELGGSTFS